MPSPAAARWLILPAMAWACGPNSTGSSSVSARLGSIKGAREERPGRAARQGRAHRPSAHRHGHPQTGAARQGKGQTGQETPQDRRCPNAARQTRNAKRRPVGRMTCTAVVRRRIRRAMMGNLVHHAIMDRARAGSMYNLPRGRICVSTHFLPPCPKRGLRWINHKPGGDGHGQDIAGRRRRFHAGLPG